MIIRATTFLVLAGLLFIGAGPGSAQETQPTEYQVKAAFIYNFAKFIEWPPEALPKKDSPFVIAVLGENPFGGALENVISNKTVNGHTIEIRPLRSAAEATNCHILFICSSEKPRLTEIFKALPPTGVLTVGESDRFTETGGMINFVVEANKVRFQIKDETAKKSKLKISSKLLSLAIRPTG